MKILKNGELQEIVTSHSLGFNISKKLFKNTP